MTLPVELFVDVMHRLSRDDNLRLRYASRDLMRLFSQVDTFRKYHFR